MAADKPDSSTPYSETLKSVMEYTWHHRGTTLTLSLAQIQSCQKQGNLPGEEEASICKGNQHRQNYVDVKVYTHAQYAVLLRAATWDRKTRECKDLSLE